MCTSASQQTFPLLSFSFVTMHYPSQYPFSILTHSVIVSYCSLLGSAVLCNCHLAWENFKHATAQASICLHLKHFLWSRIQDVSSFAIGTGPWKMNYLLCWLVQRLGKETTVTERQGHKNLLPEATPATLHLQPSEHSYPLHLSSAYTFADRIAPLTLGRFKKFWATVSVMFEGFECNINIESQEKGLMQCFYSRNTFHSLVCLLCISWKFFGKS